MQKIAVVGAGFIGQTHIEAYQTLENVKITAVVDANKTAAESAAAKASCAWYVDLADALSKAEIDIVDVCLPTFLHEENVIMAAQAGKHVLCEKPVTFTLESFDRMQTACLDNDVKFMVAQVVRWHPEYTRIRDMIRANDLGSLRMIYAKRISQHPAWSSWFTDPQKSGGGLFDLHVHDIDYLYSLLGMPKSVSAVGWQSAKGCWNHICSRLVWADGHAAICEGSIAMTGEYPFSVELRVNGERGTLDYAFSAGHNLKDGENVSRFRWYPVEGGAQELSIAQYDMFAAELGAFVDAIETGGEIPIPPVASRQVLEIVIGIRESLEKGSITVNF